MLKASRPYIRPGQLPQGVTAEGPTIGKSYLITTFDSDKSMLTSNRL